MSSKEEQVQAAFSNLLTTLSTTGKDRVAKLSEFLHPLCNGYGTALQEVFKSRRDWLSLFEEEAIQIPFGLEVTPKRCETFVIDDSSIGLMAETSFRIHVSKTNSLTFDPVRMSLIYLVEGNSVKVRHWHNSFPLGESDEEIFPGSKEPKLYDEVSVLFTDFVGFTTIVAETSPKILLQELNTLFSGFDVIVKDHQLNKIKTIGDAYMAVAGLTGNSEHAINAVSAAIAMMQFLEQHNTRSSIQWALKAGIHSGPVVGGVIGQDKLVFDIWGDTVNIASRMESTSTGGRINISSRTFDLVREEFPCEHRGKLDAKGKGALDMYFVTMN